MKKTYLYILSSILLLFNTTVFADQNDDKQEFMSKVMMSETLTISVKKETTENLVDTLYSLDTDLSLNKVDQMITGINAHLAKDTNSLFVSPDAGVPGFPNYVKAEIGDFEGLTNTKVRLNTNLSENALGLKGSNGHEVHMKASAFNLMVEILEGKSKENSDDNDSSDESSDNSSTTGIKSVLNNLISKSSLNSVKSSDDEADEFFNSLTEADDYFLTLGKRTHDELKSELNKLSTSGAYHELKDKNESDANSNSDTISNNSGNQLAYETSQARAFLANDGNSAYLFYTHKNNEYLSLVVIEKQGNEEHLSVDVSFRTNLPHETLNFVGSGSNEVNVTVDIKTVMNEIFENDFKNNNILSKIFEKLFT